MGTIISQCNKKDFRVVQLIADNVYDVKWGAEIHGFDEEYVTFENTIWYGALNENAIDYILSNAQRNASIDEIGDMAFMLDEQSKLELLKKYKIIEIERYDKSKDVDACYITHNGNSLNYWADKSERDELKGAVRDCINVGRELYRLDLRDIGVSLTIPCELLLSMLCSLEIYAIDSYNKTTDHIFAIRAMTSIDEVKAYDFTIGYPEKLEFNL